MQFPRPHPILILGPCPGNEVAFLTPSGMVSLYSSWESRLCERWAPLLHRGSWCTLPSVKFQELTRRMNHTVCDRFSSRLCTIMPDYHHIQRGGTTIISILQMEPLRFKEHSDLPRITGEWQSQGSNLEEEADRHWDYPVSKSRRFPGGIQCSSFQGSCPTPPPISPCTPSATLVPFSLVLAVIISSLCILTLTSSSPVVEGHISLVTQCSRLWVYLPRGSNPGSSTWSVGQTCFLISLGIPFPL